MVISEASEKFGVRLENAIRGRKFSFSRVANECGLSRPSMSHYIYGERLPKVDAMMKIAKFLNLTPEELYYIMEAFDEDSDDYPD